jgi:hypothetical protein
MFVGQVSPLETMKNLFFLKFSIEIQQQTMSLRNSGLYFICFFCSGCLASPDSSADDHKVSDGMIESSTLKRLQSEKSRQLIETILHLPEVLKRSAFELLKKDHKKIFIVIPDNISLDAKDSIQIKGINLTRLKTYKDLSSDQPGYVFTKIEVHEDQANVQLVFDMTGMIVHGGLTYKNNVWTPNENFVVSYQ